MKLFLIALLSACAALPIGTRAADGEKAAADPSKPQAAAAGEAAKASPEELEAKFKAMLARATLSGRWAPIQDGQLGEEKSDQYHIVGASKVKGDSWIINAKMKYNDREFVLPIPVTVKWAGDAPVIIVDNLSMPGGNRAYSARVLIYDQTYAGTWTGGNRGGLLNGIITNDKDAK